VTLGELRTKTLQRSDEDPAAPVYYTAAEATDALNAAQRLFVLLTLCLERTTTLTLQPNRAFHRLRSYVADFLLPLRLKTATGRLLPATLAELDALDSRWMQRSGTPSRYTTLGWAVLALTAQPSVATEYTLTYAASPALLAADTDIPEIPARYHEVLVDYAIYHLRVKDGGAKLAGAMPLLERFLSQANEAAGIVRARASQAGYDTPPAEIELTDLARIARLTKKTETK
jgi:hypothetical protein